MKIYNVEITIEQSPVKVDMRHDWLVRQADDLEIVVMGCINDIIGL